MTQSIAQPFRFDQWLDDSLQNAGVVTASPWFDFASGFDPGSDAPPSFAATAPGQGTHPSLPAATNDGTPDINSGVATYSLMSSAGVAPSPVEITTSQSIFSGGSATAASASDLNALITAADSQSSA